MATRGNWSSWLEFLLSCVGCMVGIGNIWRFPFVCYRSGGAAFLIPYFLAMAICGLPLVFLEMSYCQYSNLGPGKVWVICPLFKGIGVGMMILTAVISCYYNVVLSWTLYYLFMSFRSALPWSSCGQSWNTANCVDAFGGQRPQTLGNGSGFNNYTIGRNLVLNSSLVTTSSSQEFWVNYVLEETDSLNDIGTVRWPLLACLLIAWVAAFLCLIKGIKSSGKVVYVAATAPYLILLALLIRGAILPGAIDGVRYYIIPRWERLLDGRVWFDAAVQVFYSAGIGWGGISTLASYNRFNNNCYRDAMILPVLDCLTSWFAGFVIFVFLGYMAHVEGKSVDQVVASGPGLSFVTYPQAVATMPLSQLWSVLFFTMLFLVGMDSQFVHIQTIVTGLSDGFPSLARTSRRKMALTAVICLVGFVCGIPFVTQGGIHLLNLVDSYISTISVMLLATVEVLVLSWIYGVRRLYEDIAMMIGYTPTVLWKPLWLVVSPLFCIILWIFGVINLNSESVQHNGSPWITSLGVFVGILPVLPLPILSALVLLSSSQGNFKERLRVSVQPTSEWRPAKDKKEEEESKAFKLEMKELLS